MRLYLVRHAAVVPRPEQTSANWHLSAEGRAGADALAREVDWSSVERLYSSAEPKAITTAQRVAMQHGLPLYIEADLGEVERPWVEGDYKALASRYLGGERIDGWEPFGDALARVQAAIARIAASEPDVGVVSHGLAISLFLSDYLRLDGQATAAMWSAIRFPDVAVLDMATRKLERPFGG